MIILPAVNAGRGGVSDNLDKKLRLLSLDHSVHDNIATGQIRTRRRRFRKHSHAEASSPRTFSVCSLWYWRRQLTPTTSGQRGGEIHGFLHIFNSRITAWQHFRVDNDYLIGSVIAIVRSDSAGELHFVITAHREFQTLSHRLMRNYWCFKIRICV